MSYENWKDKIGTFEVMDVRGKKLDFFPVLKAKAAALKNVPYVLKHINDVMNRNQLCKVLSPKSSKTEQIALFRCA